jgi:GNAT superfamily N-acetyltransferase
MMPCVDTEPDRHLEWNERAVAHMDRSDQSDGPGYPQTLGPIDVTPLIRQAVFQDTPAVHAIRLSVHENVLRSPDVTGPAYLRAIEVTGRGWVAEEDGKVAGFGVGNRDTGNVWALFVRPECEGRGYGKALQAAMLEWLFAQGVHRACLTTQPRTRAERFYRHGGWRFVRICANGEAEYELPSSRPA